MGSKFKPQFDAWVNWLDLIGYNTYYKVINGKHMGIPQNRERIFAISIRKDVDTKGYTFPETIPLEIRLKDILEKSVDEKYYLPDDRIEKILNSTFMQEKKRIQTTDVCDTLLARDYKDPKCVPIEEEPEVKQLMNIMPTKTRDNPNQGRVYDIDGLAPTLTKMDGGNREPFIVEQEPFIVASRGRNPENPSDRTAGAPTEQRLEPNFSGCTNTLTSVQKDNYVCEPQVLRAERTEYGKEIRKQYEAGEIDEKIGNMREMKPRTDGVTNTITTLLKDNYVAEPIVYDDYNSRISADQDTINTLTTNCGASAERNGVKILEKTVIIEDQFPGSRDARIYENYSPTLRQNCGGLEVANGEVQNQIKWRIRKLMPIECWKLMAFSKNDHNKAAKYVSSSALYKQAGNSIVVNVLVALMSSLFIQDGHKATEWTKYALNVIDDIKDNIYGEYDI